MERIPAWAWVLGAAVFLGLAVWTGMDGNWAGLIVSLVLDGLCIAGLSWWVRKTT
jgi:hypothetical protein